MFDRKAYKMAAKVQAKKNWKIACLAIPGFFIALTLIVVPLVILAMTNFYDNGFFYFCYFVFIFVFQGAIIMAFLNYYVKIGNDESATFIDFLKGFKLWWKGVLAILWTGLWLILWMLCFYIPIFIKMFSYSQIFYILLDDPKIGVRKALRKSIEMTKGYKLDLFVMGLSFIPYVLIAIAPMYIMMFLVPLLGLSIIWIHVGMGIYMILLLLVSPYFVLSFVNAYKGLKKNLEAIPAIVETKTELLENNSSAEIENKE